MIAPRWILNEVQPIAVRDVLSYLSSLGGDRGWLFWNWAWRLRAEMKLSGQAWLQWETTPENGGTRLVQSALFAPKGLSGTLYWKALYPAHKIIFSGMVRRIAREASRPPGQGPGACRA